MKMTFLVKPSNYKEAVCAAADEYRLKGHSKGWIKQYAKKLEKEYGVNHKNVMKEIEEKAKEWDS